MEEKDKKTPVDGASASDTPAPKALTPREQFMLYQMGWRAGAGCHAIPGRFKDTERCAEYHMGYAAGRRAYRDAMVIARDRLGAPPPSILRTQPQHVRDIEDQFDAEMFAEIDRRADS